MSIRKIMVSLLAFYAVGAWGGVCPNLGWFDLPPGLFKKVEQVNIPDVEIYFCRDYHYRDSSHFTIDFKKDDLIGDPTGVKAIGLGNYRSKDAWNMTPNPNHAIGQSSVTLYGNTPNLLEGDNNPIIEQDIQLATKSISPWRDSSWIEYGFFHFYVKKGTKYCYQDTKLYADLRNTLRNNLQIFKLSNDVTEPRLKGEGNVVLGKIKTKLLHDNNIDTLDADLIIYWDQARRGGSAGGSVGRGLRTYCHFSVGVDIVINTRDPNFNIKKSGDYTISVGVATK